MRGVLAALLLASAACADDSGTRNVACRDLASSKATPPAGWGGTVFVIVIENRSAGDVLGSGRAPYIDSLAAMGAVARGYRSAHVHPSEPNYLWMVAGENFGILSDDDPAPEQTIESRSHLVDQIERAGLTWKAYEESMGEPCGLTSHGRYAAKHDPFVFFSDVNGWDGRSFHPSPRCTDHVVDYAQLDADIAANDVPRYAFVTPNLDDDMHDGSIEDGDRWLSREVPKILASSAYRNGGALFILGDEGRSDGDDPPFLVVSPNAKRGFVSTTAYDTSSFLKTVEGILGLEALPCDPTPDRVRTMDDLFTSWGIGGRP